MSRITVEVDTKPLEEDLKRIQSALVEMIVFGLDTLALATVQVERMGAPERTGWLRSSVNWERLDPFLRAIVPGAPHAPFVEAGTQPHVIEALPGRVLAFTWHSEQVFFRHVFHPGTHAQPFVAPTRMWLEASAGEYMEPFIERAVREGDR